jgi:hypothetical protein
MFSSWIRTGPYTPHYPCFKVQGCAATSEGRYSRDQAGFNSNSRTKRKFDPSPVPVCILLTDTKRVDPTPVPVSFLDSRVAVSRCHMRHGIHNT